MRQPSRIVTLAALALLSAAARGQALPTDADAPRNWLSLEAGRDKISSSIRTQRFFEYPGSLVQQETELGLADEATVPRLTIGRRIGQRWRIEGSHSSYRRSGSAVLKRDVDIDYDHFAAGSSVHSTTRMTTNRIVGGVSLLLTEHAELGVSFGGQWVRLQRELVSTAARSRTSDLDVMPLLGVFGQVALLPALRLTAQVESAPDGDRDWTEGHVALVWQIGRNFSLGAGWRTVRGRLDAGFLFDDVDLDYRARGPRVTLQANF